MDFTHAKRIVRSRKGQERLPLAAVRNAAGKTQVEVAEAANIPQAEVARLETGSIRLSSLTRYAHAIGGEVEVAIILGGRRYLIGHGDLKQYAPHPKPTCAGAMQHARAPADDEEELFARSSK